MRNIILIIFFIVIFAVPVSAEESQNSYYEKVIEYTESYNIDFEKIIEQPFETLWDAVKNNIRKELTSPAQIFYKITAVLLLTSFVNFFALDNTKKIISTVNLVSVVVIFTNISEDFMRTINDINTVLVHIKNFITSFIPIFAGISFASGEMITSTVYTGFFMICVVTVANFCISYIVPSVNLFLALGITSSISPIVKLKPLCEFYSKAVKLSMTAAVTVLCFVLSIQTTITQGQDNVAIKTGKLLINGAVPVIGSALQSAVGSIYASMGVLKGFFGIVGVIIIINLFIPTLIKLLINWIGYYMIAVLGSILENDTITELLSCFKDVTEILISMFVLFMILLIFSLTIMIKVTSGV